MVYHGGKPAVGSFQAKLSEENEGKALKLGPYTPGMMESFAAAIWVSAVLLLSYFPSVLTTSWV